jgi:hypothetical protein
MHVASGRSRRSRLAGAAAAALSAVALPFIGGGAPAVAATNALPLGPGYWVMNLNGSVYSFGDAQYKGGPNTNVPPLNVPAIDMEASPFFEGYWAAAADGGVFSYGVPFYGSEATHALNEPVLGIGAHPSGRGYWLAAADGGVFAHGAARYFGGIPQLKNDGKIARSADVTIIDVVGTPTGLGYWLLGDDGGIFAFGDATPFSPPPGALRPGQFVDIEVTKSGKGLWTLAADGAVYAYGDAPYSGGANTVQPQPTTASRQISRASNGDGYYVLNEDGGVFAFNGAPFLKTPQLVDPGAPKSGYVSIASRPPFSIVVDPFIDQTGTHSAWTDGPDEQLSLSDTTGGDAFLAGARILGVGGLRVDQAGSVGFTLTSGTCSGETPQIAVYADSNQDGAFDKTKKIACTGAGPGTFSAMLTDGPGALAPTDRITAADILYTGPGTVTLDNITIGGITVGSHRIHTTAGPGPA